MWLLFMVAVAAAARDVTDEEYANFPRLYDLDDYESCLSRAGGLYCLGTFRISPLYEHDQSFDIIKKYSQDPYHFNRTQIHRGYCVNSRCPQLSEERNASLRFERCAAQWARRRMLNVTLSKLSYCHTQAQNNPEPFYLTDKVLLFVLVALTVLNTLGTVYDVWIEDVKKNCWLPIWSVRRNWQRLTASYDDGDKRLAALSPVQGIRVILMWLVIGVHSGFIYTMLYFDDPRWVEQVYRHPVMMIFLNGTSAVQFFVTLSSFLLAYNLLLISNNTVLSFKMIPLIIIKRIARIFPLYMLVLGYAATLWRRASAGPMWPAAVQAESEICRQKFWTHLFYISNLIHPESICLMQTWFLAVDMQLHVIAAALTLTLAHMRRRALSILATLIVASAVLNGLLAYVYKWQSLVYYSYPQHLSTMYSEIPSFAYYYQSPWGSLPGCLVGLFCAFLHYELQENGILLGSHKWLKLLYNIAPLAIIGWNMTGIYLRERTEDWFVATYVAVERPVPSILCAIMIMGMINGMEGWQKRLMGWRGWQPLARMSLAVLLVHWCINMAIAASRTTLLKASLLKVMVDLFATISFSYIIAIPLTIMVEIPIQKFINTLIFGDQSRTATRTDTLFTSLKKQK